MDLARQDRLVRMLAFFERALSRRFQHAPYQDVAQRSRRTLGRLGGSEASLRFRVALHQLHFDWDLLSAESALDPDALRLQLRVLELASEHPEAAEAIRKEMEKAPIGRLFLAMVAQARQNDAREIDVTFRADAIRVDYDGVAGMTIPTTLAVPFRGAMCFVEAAGFSRLRAVLSKAVVAFDLRFAWAGPDRAVLRLEPS